MTVVEHVGGVGKEKEEIELRPEAVTADSGGRSHGWVV
jgi:hypothetical protein